MTAVFNMHSEESPLLLSSVGEPHSSDKRSSVCGGKMLLAVAIVVFFTAAAGTFVGEHASAITASVQHVLCDSHDSSTDTGFEDELMKNMQQLETVVDGKDSKNKEQQSMIDSILTDVAQLRKALMEQQSENANLKNILNSELHKQNSQIDLQQQDIHALKELPQPCIGITPDPSPWKPISSSGTGVRLEVDTSHCGFPPGSKPKYFTTLSGTGWHWQVRGVTSIYPETNGNFHDGFHVSLDMNGGRVIGGQSIDEIQSRKWRIQWIAFLDDIQK